jgi:hypothetical protein
LFASAFTLGASAGVAYASSKVPAKQFSSSANGVAVAVGVDNAKITANGGPGGDCTWLVNTTVTAVNLTNSPMSVANEDATEGRVVWSDATNSGVVTPHVTMTWPDSSTGYGTIPASSSIDGTADATFTIPCNATSGDLAIDFHVYQGTYPELGSETTLSGDTAFLENGTPVPVIAGVGGVIFAVTVGGLLFVRVRSRTAAPSA